MLLRLLCWEIFDFGGYVDLLCVSYVRVEDIVLEIKVGDFNV